LLNSIFLLNQQIMENWCGVYFVR